MARKKQLFQSIRDDQDETPRDIPPRPDRNAARAEARALAALATRLSRLPDPHVARLPLDAVLIGEIATLRSCGPDTSRRRQLKRVAGLLRTCDLDALHRALDGEPVEDPRLRLAQTWRRRMLDEGDPAIHEFVDAHPAVDRGQLRALARQAGEAGTDTTDEGASAGSAAKKAAKKLLVALREAVRDDPVSKDTASEDTSAQASVEGNPDS